MTGVNRVPLTPLSLLQRTATVFPTRIATVYGDNRQSYARFMERVHRLSNGLKSLGIGLDDKIAVLSPNLPMVLEAHYAIPWTGGVIVAVNTRLNSQEVAYVLNHCQAKVLLIDRGLLEIIKPVLAETPSLRMVIVAEDPAAGPDDGWRPEGLQEPTTDYDAFLASASAQAAPPLVEDEDQTIAINYTSGTTGSPKGVMFSHRGAMLNAMGGCQQHGLNHHSVLMWTLPMFHCNGWCFSWAGPGIGATNVCLRQVEGPVLRDLINDQGVTQFFGAPIVLQMLASLGESEPFRFKNRVKAGTGGAPPSPTLLAAMESLNVEVTHLYGLTETYGPNTICEVQDEWVGLPLEEYANQLSRQGVAHHLAGEMAVLDEKMQPVPADAATMGEICMRGNTVMKGYYLDEIATETAFAGGWFHSGDLAVLHPDGYVEIRDRAKDIIISGGENISTIEVENTLAAHPDIAEAAVVSRPDDKWGEVPVAFVTPKPERELTEQDVIAFCQEKLARFKCPKEVHFGTLPRTSTGKVQKYALREKMWQGLDKRVKG